MKFCYLMAMLILLAGCGNQSRLNTTDVSFLIKPGRVVLSQIGGNRTLVLGGSQVDHSQPASWQSLNPEVATIDDQGTVTAVAEGRATIRVEQNDLAATATVIVNTSAFYLSGMVRYEDREYSTGGFTGNSKPRPVRHAVVEVVNIVDEVVLGGESAADGTYMLGPFYDPQVRVRVLALTASQPDPVTVQDYQGNVYGVAKPVSLSAGDNSLDMFINNQAAGAFNIFDSLIYANTMVKENNSLNLPPLPALKAVWQSGSSQLGTYFCSTTDVFYCPLGRGIYLLGGGGGSSDTDEFDDDVIWHEYTHHLEHALGVTGSPGGNHSFSDHTLDLRLSWSEGFADYFPTAVKAWLAASDVSLLSTPPDVSTALYIDTVATFANGINIDSPGGAPYIYASNEIAVAHVLQRLQQQFGLGAVVDVYAGRLPLMGNIINLEAYWQGWVQWHQPAPGALWKVREILNGRMIFYQPDIYEPDDLPSQAAAFQVCNALCDGQIHYLYQDDFSDDKDNFMVTLYAGRRYVMETYDLSNGADTVLYLYDGDGVLLKSNDDRAGSVCCLPNNGLTLSSRVVFDAPADGDYRVQVSAAAVAPPSAGQWGTYKVRVFEP